MVYTFAHVSAAVGMNVKKSLEIGFRLDPAARKGGKHHEMPCQHNPKDCVQHTV
jgi:hypothetical protein